MGVIKILNIPTKLRNDDSTLSDIKCHYAVDLYNTPPSKKYLEVLNGQKTYYAYVKDLGSQEVINSRETGFNFDGSSLFQGAAGAFRGDSSCGIMCSVNDRVPSVKYTNTSELNSLKNSYSYIVDPESSKDALGWFVALKNCLTWKVPHYSFEKNGDTSKIFIAGHACDFSSNSSITYTENSDDPNQQLFVFLPVFENKVKVTVSFSNASDADLKQLFGDQYDTWRSAKTTFGPQPLVVAEMVTVPNGDDTYSNTVWNNLKNNTVSYSYFPLETPFYGSNISKINISIKEIASGNTWSRTFYVCPPGIKQGVHTIKLNCTGNNNKFVRTWSDVAYNKEITPSHYLKSSNSIEEGSLIQYDGFNLSQKNIKIGCFVRKT